MQLSIPGVPVSTPSVQVNIIDVQASFAVHKTNNQKPRLTTRS